MSEKSKKEKKSNTRPGLVKLPKATHAGTLELPGVSIPCWVLSDGRRVLSSRGMAKSLGMGGKGDAQRMAVFVNGKAIKPYISDGLVMPIQNPIVFRSSKGGKPAVGYEATIIADICSAVLAARRAGVLQAQQKHIAERCEVLIEAFAKVGIVALVDEATGYQHDRKPDELRQLLSAYVSEAMLPWAKRFPDEFYDLLCRVLGLPTGTRNALIAKYTKKLFYDRMMPGLTDALQELNPVTESGYRDHKHHQHLKDIGRAHLEKQMVCVITALRLAKSPSHLMRIMDMVHPVPGRTVPLFDDSLLN